MEEFVNQFEAHRSHLFGIAYRMLGQALDAEDVVQDAYLRVQASGHSTEVTHWRAYLTTLVTRLCLDRLKSAQRLKEQYVGPWLPEPIITDDEDSPEERALRRDTLSIALLDLLERLSPSERAVFVLREAFTYPYDEIAEIIGKSPGACRVLLHRAKRALGRPERPYTPSVEQRDRLLAAFMTAAETGDMAALSSLLHDDVRLIADGGGNVAAARRPITGATAVAMYLQGLITQFRGLVSSSTTEVNGETSILIWFGEGLVGVMAIEFDGVRIVAMRYIVNPEKLSYTARQLGVSLSPVQ